LLNDPHFHRLVAPLSAEIDYNTFSYLGKLLIEMGACDRAEQMYLDLQNDPSVLSQPRRLVRLQNALGVIFTYKGEHMKALEHYQISLKTGLSCMPPDHPDLAVIYKSIGSSYFNNHNYVQALQNYEQSAQLVKSSAQQADENFVVELNDCIADARELLDQNR
jgi:tetratricopeptide (TPR) repeat protein